MSDNSHKHPIKMRTFAADLEAQRRLRGELPPEDNKTSISDETIEATQEPVPKAMPASFNRPNPEKTTTDKKPELKKVAEPIKKTPIVITEPTTIKSTATPAANSTIPAFHELQKNVASIRENITSDKTQRIRKEGKKSDSSKAVSRPNIGYDATVITDTKSDRFQLFPSIVTSLKNWFTKLKAARRKKPTPQYTIPEAERRKGVIQRATSKTGTIFTADSETLREQIRRRRLQEELEDDEPETLWSPYTETGYSLLESPDETIDTTQNVVVAYKRNPQFVEPNNPTLAIPKPPTPAIESTDIDTEAATVETPEEIETEGDLLAEARWAAGNEPEETPAPNSDFEDEAFSIPSYQEEAPIEPAQPAPQPAKRRTSDTNTLTVTLLVGIVGAVAIFFVARMIFVHFTENTGTETTIAVKTEPILEGATLVGVPVSVQTLNQIPTVLSKTIASSSGGFVEFAIISGVGDEVSPSYLFEILHFDTKANLRQSLTAAHFTSVNHSEPGLLLSFVDEDAVRGGLLQWEPYLYRNLSLLHQASDEVNTSFIDSKVAEIDVRILMNAEGEEKLVYGFISDNTVLITTNSDEFSTILSMSQR